MLKLDLSLILFMSLFTVSCPYFLDTFYLCFLRSAQSVTFVQKHLFSSFHSFYCCLLLCSLTQQVMPLKTITLEHHKTKSCQYFSELSRGNECKCVESAIFIQKFHSYGFDFFPNELRKKPEVTRNATMYVDINKFPIGSLIRLHNFNEDIN